jgi:hypothetical protein
VKVQKNRFWFKIPVLVASVRGDQETIDVEFYKRSVMCVISVYVLDVEKLPACRQETLPESVRD